MYYIFLTVLWLQYNQQNLLIYLFFDCFGLSLRLFLSPKNNYNSRNLSELSCLFPNLESQCLLQPCKGGKLIKFEQSAKLGEQVIFSSKEEQCNPLFAKS